MGVDTQRLRSIHEAAWLNYGIDNDAVIVKAADEIDALRAEVAQAASVLSRIAEELGPMGDGDPCPVCCTYSHKGWCWYPALVEWDKQHAEGAETSKGAPCKP